MNLITEEECIRLGMQTPLPAPYRLCMADQAIVQPVGLIWNVRIHIHGIPYFITLTVIRNKEVNEAYSMLLGRPWLIDAKVTYDWGNEVVTIRGNGTVKTILVNQRTGPYPKLPEVLVCYNFVEGLTDEEEDRFFSTKEDLFAIGTITLFGDLGGTCSEGADPSSYPKHFSTYTEGDIVVDETPIKTKVQDMRIAA
jgi:hypothetical protein